MRLWEYENLTAVGPHNRSLAIGTNVAHSAVRVARRWLLFRQRVFAVVTFLKKDRHGPTITIATQTLVVANAKCHFGTIAALRKSCAIASLSRGILTAR